MNKNLLVIISLFFIPFGFSQKISNKKQIERLKVQIDSLNTVVKEERKAFEQNEIELNSKISDLKAKVLKQEKEISDCLNRPENLLKDANNFKKAEDYESALFTYDEIIQAYPTSKEAEIAKKNIEIINNIKKDLEIKKSEKYITKDYDRFKERTFYEDRRGNNYYNNFRFNLYFSVPDNSKKPEALRFKIGYNSSNWLFIEEVTFLIEGEGKETIKGEFENDIHSQGVYEWIDLKVDKSIKRIINAIADGKEISIRFHGKNYIRDIEMDKKHYEAITNIRDLYLKMGGNI